MDLVSIKLNIHESEALPPIRSPQMSASNLHYSSHASFPILAVAIIGILATALLLLSYYIFAIKCCLNWQRVDILSRFPPSMSRPRALENENRGLDEAAIRSIPILKFKKLVDEQNNANSDECAVCLNEFREEEKVRVIPNCGHVFHIDCVDVWLQNNANCPLCRTCVSSNARFASDRAIIPVQDHPVTGRDDEDYVVIEIAPEHGHTNQSLSRIQERPNPDELILRENDRCISRVSSMGDECFDNRQKDERFLVQPMRRSFSMDSGADSQLYLAVQEIIQRHRQLNNNDDVIISPNEGCSRVKILSFFSFGQGKGSSSKSAVQPVALD